MSTENKKVKFGLVLEEAERKFERNFVQFGRKTNRGTNMSAQAFFRHPTCRLLFLIAVFVAYQCLGASVFMMLEGPEETTLVQNLKTARATFVIAVNQCVSEEDLEQFLQKVVSAANRGVSVTRNVTMSEPNWSFGQALFFSTTVLTTIGYGRVTPLSDIGKGFCILYAVLGIPLTLILFTAIVDRLLVPAKAFLYFLFRKLGHLHKAFHIQLIHLSIMISILLIFFMLIPAAIFSVLEPTWNYLDAFYYVFISLTTIGLGDFIPGDTADQPHRALYKVATTVYLVLGLIVMMLVLAVLYEIPELNLGFHFYLKSDETDSEQTRLKSENSSASKYRKQVDESEGQQVIPNANTSTYQSFQDSDICE